ncbi:MAG: acetoacetate decarboxylase family protein [Eubacteriaceae bacterium]|nr:acetoacetate decarboxylase family protein [Eubacteriaceae bacterium]
MSLKFINDEIYMMPVFFGPQAGHRRPDMPGLPGKKMNDYYQPGDVNVVSITYETDRKVLEKMIPECYTLNDPYVTVNLSEFTNLGWQAGKTYNLVGVSCPVHFKGERDDIDGDLVLVMFENQTDPILGGRETMGYGKVFCDIPPIQHLENRYIALASGFGFRFMKIDIDVNKKAPDLKTMKMNEERSKGKMQYRYFPKVMEKGDDPAMNFTQPEIEYPTILPVWTKPDDYPYEIMEPQVTYCDGSIDFIRPEYEDMPTMYNIAWGLSDLKCKRVIGAKHVKYNDPCHYTDCYRLR